MAAYPAFHIKEQDMGLGWGGGGVETRQQLNAQTVELFGYKAAEVAEVFTFYLQVEVWIVATPLLK